MTKNKIPTIPQFTDSQCLPYISQFGQIPYELGKESGDERGISSPESARCCLINCDWLADTLNDVFLL